MDKKTQQTLGIVALFVVGYFLLSGTPLSVLSSSQITTDQGNSFLLLTRNIDQSDDIILFNKADTFTDSKGFQEKIGSQIRIKTTPLDIKYVAPVGGIFLTTESNGELAFCQSPGGCLIGSRYASTLLKPLFFNSGFVSYTYRVDLIKDGSVIESQNVTYSAPRGQPLGNVKPIYFQNGKVTLTNIALLSQGISTPELSDVLAWQDLQNPSQLYKVTSKSVFQKTNFFTQNSRFYECSTAFTLDPTIYTNACRDQVRQQLLKANGFDTSDPSAYYGNFDANRGFTYNSVNGIWTLQDGSFNLLVTLTIDKTFADSVIISADVAKPQIIGSPTVDSTIGVNSYSKICYNVKNNGQGGPVTVNIKTNPNAATFPPVVSINAGETKQICGFGYGTVISPTSCSVEFCGSNQFGTQNCVTDSSCGYNVIPNGPTPNPTPSPTPTQIKCTDLGAGWSLNPKTGACEKATTDYTTWIILAALVALGAFVVLKPRK